MKTIGEMRGKHIKQLLVLFIISGSLVMCCKSIPEYLSPVKNFETEKYLGEWYEIARYDFKFEKNMSHVKTRYSMNKDGTILVENSGYDYVEQRQKIKTGKAKLVGAKDEGRLKVSFFGPFYSGYNVVQLDPEYRYALVMGDNLKLFWILSRTPTIPDDVKLNYTNIARNAGYNVDKFIWTEQ